MNLKEIHPSYGIENYKLNYRACIPFYVLLDKDLSANEIKLYGLIEQMESCKGIVTYKNKTLCRILGVDERSKMLNRMARNLKAKGYIKREQIEVTYSNGEIKLLWCWSTSTPVIIDDENDPDLGDDSGEEQKPDNTKKGVHSVHEGGVSGIQKRGVQPVHISNTHIFKTHKDNKTLPDLEKSGIKTAEDLSKKQEPKTLKKDYQDDERFMRFYSAYPKKVDPRDAYKAFKSIVGNDDELLEQIIDDLDQRKARHSQWQEKRYIKYPAVYLRKGEYLGEIINDNEEQLQKRAVNEAESARRLQEQERYTQERREKEAREAKEQANKRKQYKQESKTYRRIISEAAKKQPPQVRFKDRIWGNPSHA